MNRATLRGKYFGAKTSQPTDLEIRRETGSGYSTVLRMIRSGTVYQNNKPQLASRAQTKYTSQIVFCLEISSSIGRYSCFDIY